MTDDLKQLIVAAHKSEQDDVTKYKELMDKAEKEGCHKIEGILHDIKHDEMTHIEALEHILEMEEHANA